MNSGRRVVITGRGVVSALGNTPEELFRRLAAGDSAVRVMSDWEPVFPAAPVELEESLVRSLPRNKRRSMGRVALFASLAGLSAARDAGLSEQNLHSPDTGCVVGSTMGSSSEMESTFRTLFLGGGMQDISPMSFFKSASHTAAFNTANLLGITGHVYSPSAACASGLQAVGLAATLIASGMQNVVLCGGAEEVSSLVSGNFALMEAHAAMGAQTPETLSRPFDFHRTGLICGEGAGILVLEEYEHAKARGAKILAEVYSFASCRCPDSISQSDSASILRCLEDVYRGSGLSPEQTDYISAHATSTIQGDRAEAEALRSLFGTSVPLSSLKGHLGHTLAASGSLELVAILEMMNHHVMIPTRNLEDIDPACAGLDHVLELRERPIRTVLKNCFAFGGINTALLLGKTIHF